MTHPVATIAAGVFVGLLACAVFVLCVSWVCGPVAGWVVMRKP